MINLKHFKKVASDDKTSTMEHPAGHRIVIAHNSLSANHRKYLESIPLHCGGEVKGYYEGKYVEPENKPSLDEAEATRNKLRSMVGQEPLPSQPTPTVPFWQQTNGPSATQINLPQIAESFGQQSQAEQVQVPQPAPQPSPYAAEQAGFGSTSNMFQEGMRNITGGIGGVGAAQSGQMAATAGIREQEAREYQTLNQHLMKANEEFHAAVDGKTNLEKLNPNQYLESLGTAGKVSTTIGLLLGGIGSGLTGGPNMAAQFLEKQIERDIDAQKANNANKQNLFNMNLQKFKNEADAINMTRMQMREMYAAQAEKVAAQYGSQQALAAAQQLKGQVQLQNAPLAGQLIVKDAAMRMVQDPNVSPESKLRALEQTGIVSPERAKEAYGEMGQFQEHQKALDNAINVFDKINGMALKGALSPGARDALMQPLVTQLSKATAGRFTEADAKFLESVFPKIGDKESTLATKREQLIKLVNEKANFPILTSLGLKAQPRSINFTKAD